MFLTHRKRNIPITKENWLMLFVYVIVDYSDNHRKLEYTLMTSFLMLQQVVNSGYLKL